MVLSFLFVSLVSFLQFSETLEFIIRFCTFHINCMGYGHTKFVKKSTYIHAQKLASDTFLHLFPPCFLRQTLSLNLLLKDSYTDRAKISSLLQNIYHDDGHEPPCTGLCVGTKGSKIKFTGLGKKHFTPRVNITAWLWL